MKEFWNARYLEKESAYGKTPNAFIEETLPQFPTGKILFPAEGEGRNAIYAAQLGWDVHAFDFSDQGKLKADQLAAEHGVSINYEVNGFLEENYPLESFDAICNVFVHFDPEIKREMHVRLDSYLKKDGIFILEAYSKEHRELNKLNPLLGGPPDANQMYSLEEIKRDFGQYEIIQLERKDVQLSEGKYHNGMSSVIRFVGRKK